MTRDEALKVREQLLVCLEDPMLAAHAEVSKNLLNKAALVIHVQDKLICELAYQLSEKKT